uniref:Uncharacterized protein n=1 Tax=Anopheles braziliensis TaxID=58242 RepID=A0A2M3ZLW8_9DIPT
MDHLKTLGGSRLLVVSVCCWQWLLRLLLLLLPSLASVDGPPLLPLQSATPTFGLSYGKRLLLTFVI